MRDEIYYGNLLGLLKLGRWNLGVEESKAMLAVVNETDIRLKALKTPVVIADKKEPIKQEKKIAPVRRK